MKTVKTYQKPPHLIAYFKDEAEKKALQDLAHALDLSASEFLRLLALPAAAQVRALLAKGANPRAVAKKLRERIRINGGAGR